MDGTDYDMLCDTDDKAKINRSNKDWGSQDDSVNSETRDMLGNFPASDETNDFEGL